ncbi:MAG: ATP-dependent zinc metalloprotease FtsH [Thermodesulfobacteriota bacterium]
MAEEKKKPVPIKGPQWSFIAVLIVLATLFYLWGGLKGIEGPVRQEITYSRFMELIESDKIQSVTIKGLVVEGQFTEEMFFETPGAAVETGLEEGVKKKGVRHFKTNLPSFQGEGLMAKLREKNIAIDVQPESGGSLFWQLVAAMLPWIIIIGVWILIMRRTSRVQGGPGGLFSFGASKAKRFEAKETTATFKDVAGLENAKAELKQTIEFLKDPSRFKNIGAKIPRGVLLMGPPGTGKTLLARAAAGEAGVPFFSISASEFIEMFVGVGASRVRDMFKKAKDSQPSIIFIDELDAVGRTRGTGLGGGHDEREQTLNQLLSEMDGFETHEEVVVMAATNRPDVLDPALLRPGRFDRHIVVDRPGIKERMAILGVHVRDKKLAEDVNLESVARGTPGMTGADLENIVNEAALIAARSNKEQIEMSDFDEARDRVLMGAAREETISEDEKRITAYHESGHTLVAMNLPGMDPIHKVTIMPRGLAMGVTQMLPKEDRHFYPKSYLLNRLTVALGGRVAEKLVFKDVSTGAQNDLKDATGLAEKMVGQWGMSDKFGPLNLGRGEEHPFLGRELAMPKHYSEDMARLMDEEIRKFIMDAEKKAETILKTKRHVLDKLAAALIEDEVLDKKDIDRIIEEAGDGKEHKETKEKIKEDPKEYKEGKDE